MTRQEAEYEEKFNNPFQAAKVGYIDDVILPRWASAAHVCLGLHGQSRAALRCLSHGAARMQAKVRLSCLPTQLCWSPAFLQTRQRLCAELETLANKRAWRPERKHGNIPL